ncbi:MAG: hemerythrin domain-containing protein [Gallionella sp.]
MKRSPALQQLSREHHNALRLAKACVLASQSGDEVQVVTGCQHAIEACSNELWSHFKIEEQSLLPLLRAETDPLVVRTLSDHNHLRALLSGLHLNNAQVLNEFGRLLALHVRFEERELFPVIESLLEGRFNLDVQFLKE